MNSEQRETCAELNQSVVSVVLRPPQVAPSVHQLHHHQRQRTRLIGIYIWAAFRQDLCRQSSAAVRQKLKSTLVLCFCLVASSGIST